MAYTLTPQSAYALGGGPAAGGTYVLRGQGGYVLPGLLPKTGGGYVLRDQGGYILGGDTTDEEAPRGICVRQAGALVDVADVQVQIDGALVDVPEVWAMVDGALVLIYKDVFALAETVELVAEPAVFEAFKPQSTLVGGEVVLGISEAIAYELSLTASETVTVQAEAGVLEGDQAISALVGDDATITVNEDHAFTIDLPAVTASDAVTVVAEAGVLSTVKRSSTLVGDDALLSVLSDHAFFVSLPPVQASDAVTLNVEGAVLSTVKRESTLVGSDAPISVSEDHAIEITPPPQSASDSVTVQAEAGVLDAVPPASSTLLSNDASIGVTENQSSNVNNFSIDSFSAQLDTSSDDLQVSGQWSDGETTYDWTLKNESTGLQIDSDLTFNTSFNKTYGSQEHTASGGDTLRLRITDDAGNGITKTERTTVVAV